jgi:DNA-binding FadR family transcriptional regulator
MVAGILRGDADGAAEAMRRHILSSGQSWENMSAMRGTGISPPSAA